MVSQIHVDSCAKPIFFTNLAQRHLIGKIGKGGMGIQLSQYYGHYTISPEVDGLWIRARSFLPLFILLNRLAVQGTTTVAGDEGLPYSLYRLGRYFLSLCGLLFTIENHP